MSHQRFKTDRHGASGAGRRLGLLRIFALFAVGALAAGCSETRTADTSARALGFDAREAAERGFTTDPLNRPPGTWVVLQGTVRTKVGDSFTLYTGFRDVRVEFDGWSSNDRNSVLEGDHVWVHGTVDHDIGDGTELNAEKVYVSRLNAFLHAADREGEGASVTPNNGGWVSMTGIVREKDGDEFTLEAGNYRIVVDAEGLDADRARIANGDAVRVVGTMDGSSFFETREIRAASITALPDGQPDRY